MSQCPYCHRQLKIVPDIASQPVMVQTRQFNNTQLTPWQIPTESVPQGGEWEKVTPVGKMGVDDVLTSIFDAGVSFGLVTAGTAIVVYLADWHWSVAPITGLGVAIWRYFGGISATRSLLYTIESWTHTDLNRDGVTGQPVKTEPVKLEIIHKNERGNLIRAQLPQLPEGVGLDAFGKWCLALAGGAPISEDRWVGPGQDFTKSQYRELLKTMAAVGIIRKNGEAANSKWVVSPGKLHTLGNWSNVCLSVSVCDAEPNSTGQS